MMDKCGAMLCRGLSDDNRIYCVLPKDHEEPHVTPDEMELRQARASLMCFRIQHAAMKKVVDAARAAADARLCRDMWDKEGLCIECYGVFTDEQQNNGGVVCLPTCRLNAIRKALVGYDKFSTTAAKSTTA